MTMAQYERATVILKEKEELEEKLYRLRMSTDYATDESIKICNRLFTLGQEFDAL